MKDRASIFCVLAAITLGIFADWAAGTPVLNKTEPIKKEAPHAPIAVQIESVILKLAAKGNQTKSPMVNFSSFTYWNPTIPDLFELETEKLRPQLRSSYFDAGRLTVFVADGWMKNGSSEMSARLREEYVKHNKANVVVVDWEGQNFPTKKSAATQLHGVAEKIATLVAKLAIFAHLDLDRTIFVGHSMGAHVMGAAGKILEGLVDSVVGLDPSPFSARAVNVSEKLDRSSGKYVQVIHTNGRHLGLNEAIGSADFFANNGLDQPGCRDDNVCSHKRAWQYFAESINSDLGFYGTKCLSNEYYDIVQASKNLGKNDVLPTCTSRTGAQMGGLELDHGAQGIFMFETGAESPFALGVQLQPFKHYVP